VVVVNADFLAQKIKNVERLDIYLIRADSSPQSEPVSSYVCGHVYLKAEDGNLFQVDGDLLEVDADEVAFIVLSKGWSDLEIIESRNERKIKFGAKLNVVTESVSSHLIHYASIYNPDVLVGYNQQRPELHLVESLTLLEDGKECVSLMQDAFPYTIIVSKIK
jgi:hypothetical protein